MKPHFAPIRYDVINMAGGYDEMTPILSLKPGVARQALNFECSEHGGYRRIGGYERFDGQTSPSDAVYKRVYVTSFVNVPVLGDTITGSSSGATGVVVGIGADYIAYTKATGVFDIGVDTIMVGATTIGLSTMPTGGVTAKNHAIYTAAAADVYRNDITAVPGSQALVGGFLYNDTVYALRPNAGGTAVDMYKSSPTGWVQVPFYNEVSFDSGGTAIPSDGDTLTQGGVTAIVKRVVLENSDSAWSGTAAGRLIITTPAGGNFSAGAATIGSATCNLLGAESAITMTPSANAKLESVIGNLYGGSDTKRVYACDGVNRGFEFDGDVLVPINTGTTPDAPKYVLIHSGYLWWTFGSSLLSSAPGLPYDYTAVSGANEIAVGEDITGIISLSGEQSASAMLITTRSQHGTSIMYGKSWADFNVVSLESGGGAIDRTVQNMGQTYMFDDRGVTSLAATLNFGNFDSATLTTNINRLVYLKRTLVSCTALERRKGQYRIFFTDGTALYITIINGKHLGNMPVTLGHKVVQAFGGKLSTGEDVSFICTDDGYVMQMEKGTSFDGGIIDASLQLNYAPSRSHRMRKRYRKCGLEVFGGGYVEIGFGYKLGYGTQHISQPPEKAYVGEFNVAQWDSFTWDAFTWDGSSDEPIECEMRGTGENVALTFRTATNYYGEYTINSATLHYSPRRALR